MDMSSYVLSRVLSHPATQFREHIDAAASGEPSYGLAELNTLLTELPAADRHIAIPLWTRAVPPLDVPWFASGVLALRHYLLTHSPAPFRCRNLFVDSTLGARI